MADSRTVSRELKRTARSVRRIPDDGLRDAVLDIRREAGRIGGTFNGRQLSADVKQRRRGYRHTSVVFGRPAGYWAIRTYGRRASRVRRHRGLPVASGVYRQSVGPAGRARTGRWDQVFDYAARTVPRRMTQTTERILARG